MSYLKRQFKDYLVIIIIYFLSCELWVCIIMCLQKKIRQIKYMIETE